MILDKTRVTAALFLSLTLALAACNRNSANIPRPSASSRPIVVATTSTLAALVKSVGGDAITVHALVPIGASPETYEPTPRDVIALNNAALVVENGAGLENWLAKLIRTSSSRARILTLSSGLTGSEAQRAAQGQFVNPHFWLDPIYAAAYVKEIEAELARLDPPNAVHYRANADAEEKRLQELDSWIRRRIATIPPGNRAMIAFHDAWYYFDRRYGIRDVGAIEASPGKEPSAADLAGLIAAAKANGVRAVFAEPEFSPKLAKQLAESAGIRTVTNLYDDSLGNTPELSSYEGMMHHDVDTIVQALGS